MVENTLWEGITDTEGELLGDSKLVLVWRVCDETTTVVELTASELNPKGARLVVGCETKAEDVPTESVLEPGTLDIVNVPTSALVLVASVLGPTTDV